MARKSGWQQFAENFKSTYGAVNDFGRDGAARDIMDQEVEEQFDASGASTGFSMGGKNYASMNDVGLQKNKELADNLAKHGDTTGAAALRASNAKTQGQSLDNQYSGQSLDARLKALELGNVNTQSKTANTDANTKETVVDTAFKVDTGGLKKEQLKENVNKTVIEQGKILADTENVDAKTRNQYELNAQAAITTQENANAYAQNLPLNNALVEHANTKWGSPEESKNALVEIYGMHGDKDGKGAALIKSMRAEDIAGVLHTANVASAEVDAMLSDPSKGVTSVAQWINDSDGIEGNDVGVMVIDGQHVLANTRVDEETGEVIAEKPYYMTGANEQELAANLRTYAMPGKSVELAKQMLDFKKSRAGLGKTKAETNKLNAEAKTGGRDYEGDLNIKSMNDFVSDPDSTHAALVRKATASGLKTDWDKVAESEIAHQQLLNRARGNNSSNTGLGGVNNVATPVGGKGWGITPKVK